jgi:amino acid transporter
VTAPVLKRSLTVVSLVFVLYFTTSGGPFTTEGLVAEVGPGLALLIMLLVPLLWSVPEALIIGELASMLPEEGGYYRWVRRAFGPFWAVQNGWWTWMYSLVDMAIYPVLFTQYLGYFFPSLGVDAKWVVALVVIWTAAAINLRGALPVGRVSVLAGGFIIVAFLAMSLAALPHVSHAPWLPLLKPGRTPAGALGIGLSIALWNYIGWDNASTVQGEVVDASRSYPRALAVALPLVTLGYLTALCAALAATDWTRWRDGAWPEIARAAAGSLGGSAIAVWIGVAGMVSALALFNALLLSYSRIPLAMAIDGYLPAWLGRTDARGTPRNAVLVSAACYSVFVLLSIQGLVVADVLLYAMALFLEFGALIQLRRAEPDLRGAFRIPIGRAGVICLAALPMVILLGVVALEMRDGEYGRPAVACAVAAALLGPAVYAAMRRRRTAIP